MTDSTLIGLELFLIFIPVFVLLMIVPAWFFENAANRSWIRRLRGMQDGRKAMHDTQTFFMKDAK